MEHDRAPGAEPGPYPAELVSEVMLGDGTGLTVRPIRPDDAPRLVAFHATLSQWTVYLRFFSSHRQLSDDEVRRFTRVDYQLRLALVVENDRGLVAVGRYDRLPGSADAEVAFVVADDFQHHGIGTLLLEELARAAWARGVTHFVAEVLTSNTAMLRVFFDSHYEVEWDERDGTVELRFPIDPAGRSAAAAPNHRVRA
jgi:GNAT superfamily N-acetyltransferase